MTSLRVHTARRLIVGVADKVDAVLERGIVAALTTGRPLIRWLLSHYITAPEKQAMILTATDRAEWPIVWTLLHLEHDFRSKRTT